MYLIISDFNVSFQKRSLNSHQSVPSAQLNSILIKHTERICVFVEDGWKITKEEQTNEV